MKTASSVRRLHAPEQLVSIRFAGAEVKVREGGNLAAELLAAGISPFRETPVSGAPRNPYCMMGACFDCLVEIDGVARQACMTEVVAGMTISRLAAVREADNA